MVIHIRILPIIITVCNSKVIFHLLLDLKPNKAPMPNTIPVCLLKELAYEFTPVIAVICKATLEQGCLPTEWNNVVLKMIDHIH